MTEGIVRKGKVSYVDVNKREVRVFFPEDNLMSGWLKVLRNPPFIPARGSAQKTEKAYGGAGDASFAEHSHNVTIAPWLPDIDDIVVCIYEPGFNGDGYVLGAL